jgi:hypothetical protein
MVNFPYAQLRKHGLDSIQCGRIKAYLDRISLSSGPEFTVSRLKVLKMWYLAKLGGSVIDTPGISFRKNLPKGPLRPIFVNKKPKSVLTLLTLLYTGYVSERVTELQFRKFRESVERQPGPDLFIPFLKEVALENRMQNFKLLTYRSYQFNGTKRSPASFNTTAPNFIERLKDDFQCKGVRDILDDQTCCDVMADSLDDIWYPLNFEVDEIDPDPSVGRISVIQERGLKARFIANPKLSFQIGLRSLGYNLFALLRTLPWDCTYDQQKGIDWGQTQLKEGKRLYSVDIRLER